MPHTTTTRCDWCRKPNATHTETEHPLRRDHPDYDAFYDATDSDLAAMTADALRNH
ncbi:hypothetical protein ACH4T9_12505 [Micromonospora sp. NPDC020750]|uniref:hypothetical protein n=1 Tax=unclassified Micromonospora TaxID=2617518 RepID=UPI0037A5589D